MPPSIIDDYYYHFRILSDGEGVAKFSTLPITSWGELAESIYNLRLIHHWQLTYVIYIVSYMGVPLLDILNVFPAHSHLGTVQILFWKHHFG